jgi:hypothetical protein
MVWMESDRDIIRKGMYTSRDAAWKGWMVVEDK